MQLFSVEYKNFEVSDLRKNLWCERLQGISPEAVLRAAMALIDEGHDYPPNIGKIKNKAILLENAHLSVSPSTAWGRVLLKIKSKEFKLSPLETKALACTCDLYNLRTMKASDLSYERNFFIKHYEELRNKEIQKVITVKQDFNLLESNNGQAKELTR
jgi:hypothetical protein